MTASSPAGVLAAASGEDFDAVLIDLNYARDTTSGREGMDLLGHHWNLWEELAHLPAMPARRISNGY